MLSGLKLLALALFLYDLFHLRRLERREADEANEKLEGVKMSSNSNISLDNCKPDTDTAFASSRREHLSDISHESSPEAEPMLPSSVKS